MTSTVSWRDMELIVYFMLWHWVIMLLHEPLWNYIEFTRYHPCRDTKHLMPRYVLSLHYVTFRYQSLYQCIIIKYESYTITKSEFFFDNLEIQFGKIIYILPQSRLPFWVKISKASLSIFKAIRFRKLWALPK